MSQSVLLPWETKQQDGAKTTTGETAAPISVEMDEFDAKSVARSDVKSTTAATRTGSSHPLLLGKDAPAPVADDATAVDDLDRDHPEGGTRSWLVVLGCWLSLFASLGFMNVLASFQTYVTDSQPGPQGRGTVGGLIFAHTFLSLLLGIYVGPLFDKYGPRWLLVAGTASLVASLILASISSQFWLLLAALGVLGSVGSSLLFIPAIAAIGHFFKVRRGFATAVAMTAGPVSGVVFPFIVQSMSVRIGFQWAIRALALVCLAITVAANFLVRSRLPAPAPADASPQPDARIFRTKGFTPTIMAAFLAQLAAFIPLTYISAFVLSKGFTQAFSFDVVTVLNASSAVGRVVAAWPADKIGPFNASIVFSAIGALACFGVWLPAGGTSPGLVIFAVIFGVTSGSHVSLMPVSVGRLCKTRDYGRYYGTAYTVVSLAVLFAIPIAAGLVGGNGGGSYRGLIVTTGVFYLLSVVAFAAAKVAVVGRKLWVAF